MKIIDKIILSIFFLCFTGMLPSIAFSSTPVLNFSDLITGPNNGLGDGLGEGTIVTIWGNNLGGTQGVSKVFFKDSSNVSREASHVYYLVNANGTDGGPSDLFTYHKMQEIAFSIPSASAVGPGKIYVNVDGVNSNELDFEVRPGTIHHVKTTGNDANSGTWSSPWLTMGKAVGSTPNPGDITYVGDGVTRTTGLYAKYSRATPDDHISVVAYPGATVTIDVASGYGIGSYNSAYHYMNFSKITSMSSGNGAFSEGRYVGMKFTNATGGCADGQAGAVWANKNLSSGVKILGCYIPDFGCNTTNKKHHMFYLTNRSGQIMDAYEIGWNYLVDGWASGALHVYDENICGGWKGTIKLHDNVVVNQEGLGFGMRNSCIDDVWTFDVELYNNLFINVGKADITDRQQQAITVRGSRIAGDIYIYNNTVYGYGDPDLPETSASWEGAVLIDPEITGNVYFYNNIIVDTYDEPFFHPSFVGTPAGTGSNIWYNGGDGTPKDLPSWAAEQLTLDPLFVNPKSGDYTLQKGSPAVNAGSSILPNMVSQDLNGISRFTYSPRDIGCLEYYGDYDGLTPPVIKNITIL